MLHDLADERGELNRRKLWCGSSVMPGRIVDGLRFVRASGNRSAEAWQVESVSSVSSVPLLASMKSVGTAAADNAYAHASCGS